MSEANSHECDGNCEKHEGQIRRVHVTGAYYIPEWDFWYCDEAIREDIRRGLLVEIL